MRERFRAPAYRYPVAIAATAGAGILQLALAPVFREVSPFLPFVVAVVLAAWYGSLGAGVLATVLAVPVCVYELAGPSGILGMESAEVAGIVVFVFTGLTVSWLCGRLHRTQRHLRDEQARLRGSHAFQAAIAELSADFGYDVRLGDDGPPQLEDVTDGFRRVLGYELDELNAAGGWGRLIHPDDLPRFRDPDALLDAAGRVEGETRILTKDGRVVWVRYANRALRDEAGRPVRLIGAARDVTARKEAEDALRTSEERLRESDRRKDEFLAILAHELRNPLAPLRNALAILDQSGDDAAVIRRVRPMMERQLGVLVRLVDDLLDVSRITRDRLELRREPVEVGAVIAQAVETIRPLVDAARHQLVVATTPETLVVDADPVRLAQVIANLLNNACKFTPPGGQIWLRAERQGDELALAVKDTGAGIAPEMACRVFDLFTQLDHSLERTSGGLGIGLTLVKRLVELHGGTVAVHSDGPGKGSEFRVRLPLVAEPGRAAPAAQPVPELGPRPAVRRILVVDDNRDAAESLAVLLQLRGNETRIASDGAEALDAVGSFRPDLVLLDIGLPSLNGYEVARRIRSLPFGQAMLLVAVTGWGQPDDRRRSEAAGFDVHVVKPLDPGALDALLAERARSDA